MARDISLGRKIFVLQAEHATVRYSASKQEDRILVGSGVVVREPMAKAVTPSPIHMLFLGPRLDQNPSTESSRTAARVAGRTDTTDF